MFECQRCGYKTDNKKIFKNHLDRKRLCQPVLLDISREDLKGAYPELYLIKERRFVCEYCEKRFTSSQTKYIHKRTCPVKVQQSHTSEQANIEELARIKTEMSILQQKMESLQQSIPQSSSQATTNNTVNQNQCVNIQINAFGKETTHHLTEPFLTRCVKLTNKGLVQLLDKLHFDPNVKQNANVRILNKKLELAETRDERGDWKYARKDKTLADMMDRGQEILQEHFDDNQEEIRDSLSETMYEYIVKWFQKMEDKDKNVIEDVLTDIYVLVLNKSRDLDKHYL